MIVDLAGLARSRGPLVGAAEPAKALSSTGMGIAATPPRAAATISLIAAFAVQRGICR